MKIIQLTAKNVKRLKAVEIRPEGNVVVIGGRNGQGKSSVLDAITYALGGKETHCRRPVRDGEEKAEVICDLGDLVVKRTFTAEGGSAVYVSNAEGARFTSPQGVLDRLVGHLTLDPLEFSRMQPAQQAETLRKLSGLHFDDLDARRREAYEERTAVNREGKAIKSRFDALPHHQDAPASEVSSAEVLAELDAARTQQAANAHQRARASQLRQEAAAARMRADDKVAAIADLEQQLARMRDEAQLAILAAHEATTDAETAMANADALVDVDDAPIRARLDGLEAANRKFRENAERERQEKALEALRAKSAALTEAIQACDTERAERIAKAAIPVPGLGFDAEGFLTLNGVPFDQASSAERMRVSVAMGMAANPKLRVLLIRDGSLLDEDSLRLVGELAAEHDAQVWIERVEDDDHVGVVIEDGQVASAQVEDEVAS